METLGPVYDRLVWVLSGGVPGYQGFTSYVDVFGYELPYQQVKRDNQNIS